MQRRNGIGSITRDINRMHRQAPRQRVWIGGNKGCESRHHVIDRSMLRDRRDCSKPHRRADVAQQWLQSLEGLWIISVAQGPGDRRAHRLGFRP